MGNARRMCTIAVTLALTAAPALHAQTYPAGNDPRDGLKPGLLDAGTAMSGMRLVSFTPKPTEFDSISGLTFINSDLAFRGNYVYQGNFSGFSIWDVSNPAKPVKLSVVSCVTSQGDPSIYGNLLFISAEGGGNRNDCAKGGVENPRDPSLPRSMAGQQRELPPRLHRQQPVDQHRHRRRAGRHRLVGVAAAGDSAWAVGSSGVANSFGNGVVFPFLAIYLTRQGYSATQAGFAIGAAAVAMTSEPISLICSRRRPGIVA